MNASVGEPDLILPGQGYDAFLDFLYKVPSQPALLGQKRRKIAAAPTAGPAADQEWMANYEALKLYHAQNGTTLVPFGKETGTLRSWTERQKKLYAISKLEQDQIDLLKALDFDFTMKKPLSSSRSVNSVAKPAPKPAMPAKTASAKKQASTSKKGLFSSSSKPKKEKTTSAPAPAPAKKAPVVHKASPIIDDDETWSKQCEQLKAFQAKNGTCEVPFGKETGALRSWTERQKKLYASSKLEAERVEKLNELGIVFPSIHVQSQ